MKGESWVKTEYLTPTLRVGFQIRNMKNDPLKISGMHDGATPKVFRNAARLRANMTEAETKLWDYLKTKPMNFKFRRQHPLAGYVLDFYCHKLRVSIELDGGYHFTKKQRAKDAERTSYLNKVGIREIRFQNDEISNNFESTVQKINTYLSAGSL